MKNVILLMTLVLFVSSSVRAEEVDAPIGVWQKQADLSLNITQSTFSSNWSSGDLGAMNWVFNGDFKAENHLTEVFHLSNFLQLAYGQTSKQELGSNGKKTWTRPDKSTDLILFESMGRFSLHKWVDPYVAVRFESSFVDESAPEGNLLFNPIKLTESAGVARVWHKDQHSELISRVGAGFRQNSGRSFIDLTGDETERFTTTDGGFEFLTAASYPFWDNAVSYTSEFLVFWPVQFSGNEDLQKYDEIALGLDPAHEEIQDFWKTPDVSWQNRFTAQITKYLAVNLFVHVVYDKFDSATNIDTSADPAVMIPEVQRGVRKGTQFKETLALSITYRLF